MELGHVIAVLHYFHTVSIEMYNRPDLIFAKAPIGIDVETLLGGYISSIVQAFFTYRARRLTGAKLTTSLCWFLCLARSGLTTALVAVLIKTTLADFERHWGWLVTTTLAVGATVDIIVASLLCYHLYMERTKSFERTTRLIDRIILMTVQTGFITSLLTIAVMVTFETMVKSYVWVALYMCLARVFSNSLFATLNARTSLRRMADHVHSLRFANTPNKEFKFEAARRPEAEIEMELSGVSQSTYDPRMDLESAPNSAHTRQSEGQPAGVAL
ncbi:hypothetical protein HGRIS_009069 [Hohenbuehelia grisea]|uniref:DUF6534 domain-containing protein n=1 Tax=Hohenbuehelia grisea TaxID=104357 RepID=A0ABR3J082_9AGAR